MNADDVAARIITRYDRERGWSVLREVSPFPTKGETTRRYDALALSLWGSMGVQVHGFEIKTAKSDWNAERLNPAKSAPLAKPCDFWWVVAPRDVVDVKTIPPGWGVLHVVGNGLRVAVQAPKREPVRNEAFWQCMLSRMAYRTDKDEAAQLRALTIKVKADHAKLHDRGAVRDNSAFERLKVEVDEFEKLSGLTIHGYQGSGAKAAALARMVSSGEHTRVIRAVTSAAGMLKHATESMEALRAKLGDADD